MKKHLTDDLPADFFNKETDICSFDYIVIDKINFVGDREFIEASTELNRAILRFFLLYDHVNPVYENELSVILKNSDTEKGCFV